MREAGLSIRAIAAATGVSYGTVRLRRRQVINFDHLMFLALTARRTRRASLRPAKGPNTTRACRAPVAACRGGPSWPLCEGRKSTTKLPLTFRNGLKNGERTRVRACQIRVCYDMKKPPRSQCSCGMARVSGWCPRRGLNPRPRDYETHPLPSNRAGYRP